MLRLGKSLLVFTSLLLVNEADAQKKQFTMAEAVTGMGTTLAPKGVRGAAWVGGSNILMYQKEGVATAFDAQKGETVPLTGSLQSWKPGYTFRQKEAYYYQSGDTLFFKGGAGNAITLLPKNAANIHMDAAAQYTVFTVDNNLYYALRGGAAVALTHDTNRNIISGQAVHRNEFGIDNGIFISPKGHFIAYYRMDQTMVSDYPVIDWSKMPAKNENVKYPMAGDTSHEVMLRVYNPENKSTIELKTGEHKDHYLTAVTWSPDEKHIYVGILNRKQNHLLLNQYDARTGEKVKTLFEEKDEKYVEPQHPLSFLPGSNDQFVWWSQRDGYMHLYLYNTNGKLIKQLTNGPWIVNEILAFNKDKNEIIFTGTKDSPLEKHAYTINWKNGNWSRIDKEAGTHNFLVSDDGRYLYDVLTATGVPRKTMVRATDGSMTKVLLDSPDPLANYDRPQIQDVKLKADDGTRLYGKLILPTGFDSTKKYPVIVYLYNGPHVQLVKNGFPESGNLWYEYLAQHGYIVWTMDGRGSSNRGLAFEQATFRKLGTVEMDDHMQGVNYLKSLPYVDAGRLGIHGWSFGGFMTTSFMLRHPGVFKCGVAGGPVMDWRMYEIMYTERYMDTPEENPEGYAQSNLLSKVKNLKGKLMLIHGTQDATVVWQHSIDFIKKSVDENVQVDYFVYPGYEHNVRGKDRVHLMQKITDYFDQNL
jgi:dipeptidyl-peptidase-4